MFTLGINQHIAQQWQASQDALKSSEEASEKTIEELRAQEEFTKKCNEETIACCRKERFKVASINFVFKAYDLKNSGKSLVDLAVLFKNKKQANASISKQSITELLNNMEHLKKEILELDNDWNLSEVDAIGNQLCCRILSMLKVKDPVQELVDTVKSLNANSAKIQTIIETTVFKAPASKSSHEKLMLESSNQENKVCLFIRKFEGMPAHQILGIASDALMPEIVKGLQIFI